MQRAHLRVLPGRRVVVRVVWAHVVSVQPVRFHDRRRVLVDIGRGRQRFGPGQQTVVQSPEQIPLKVQKTKPTFNRNMFMTAKPLGTEYSYTIHASTSPNISNQVHRENPIHSANNSR